MKQPYGLRLLERCAFYCERTHQFRDWLAGTIINNPTEIEMVEARGAPFERIETDE
jgi:hypothetical protein